MRVCFFGTYNRDHSANRIVRAAALELGHDVIEIHEPVWERTRDKGPSYFGPLSLVANGMRWLRAALRLAWRWHTSGGAPVVVIGFNGQLDILLLRLLVGRDRPRIVYAPLVSVTETLVDDRRRYAPGSVAARLLAGLDRLCFRLADVAVADTEAHRRYFVEALGVAPARVVVCHLGVDNDAFAAPTDRPTGGEDRDLEVLWFGQYLPLHGLDVIADAVGRLADVDGVRFTFIGTGDERRSFETVVRATRAKVEFVNWVAYEELGRRVSRADVVLGIFGPSVKAAMVVPNKVYEAAAVGAAIVTADTDAIREVFEPDRDLCVCEPDGESLAAALRRLLGDAELRCSLGAAASASMARGFSGDALARAWQPIFSGRDRESAERPRVGVAVVHFEAADEALRCVRSVVASAYEPLDVTVVDCASSVHERDKLRAGLADYPGVRAEFLDRNLGYAGANNRALQALFDAGCEYALILNPDTVVTPEAVSELVDAAAERPDAGPFGARIAEGWPGAPPASLGERYWPSLLWAPRALLRCRRQRYRPYAVGGVVGCAMLVPRALFERLDGFREDFFAYYEEVDLCLRARAAGFRPTVAPFAEVGHGGARGFAGGMTPVAAYLKARNLWRLGVDTNGPLGTSLFAPGYFALLAASWSAYALRGRRRIARALWAGVRAGWRGEAGPPPGWIFVASGLADGASAAGTETP